MTLTIPEFNVNAVPIRSPPRWFASADRCDALDLRARVAHPRLVAAEWTHVDERDWCPENDVGEMSACHNFEVQHERKIFDVAMPSDEA